MPDTLDPIQRLLSRRLRNAKGELLQKPMAPRMRLIEKGPWTYREVEPTEQPAAHRERLLEE